VVLVVLVVLANDHLIMITAHFPLFFLKIRHFFYRYQLVDPKDPTYNDANAHDLLGKAWWDISLHATIPSFDYEAHYDDLYDRCHRDDSAA
ncbi:MAG: hypothetical protein ACRC5A_10815, partial [Enterobacteriaceae bacterium]